MVMAEQRPTMASASCDRRRGQRPAVSGTKTYQRFAEEVSLRRADHAPPLDQDAR
jgi:hypothetical protein